MAKKTKKNNTAVQPIITLSDADKLFLASMRSDDEKFAYVLALVCNRKPDSQAFELGPVRDVYVFESKSQADAFDAAAQQMIKMNKLWVPDLFRVLADQINLFNKNQKSR